jgi:hypothetical protein
MVVVRFVAVIPNEGSGKVVLHPGTRRSVLPSGPRVPGCGLGEVDAGSLDDGPPRGSLAGANRGRLGGAALQLPCELLLSRGEELPGDTGSERLRNEMVNCLVGVILK